MAISLLPDRVSTCICRVVLCMCGGNARLGGGGRKERVSIHSHEQRYFSSFTFGRILLFVEDINEAWCLKVSAIQAGQLQEQQ